MNNPKYTDCMIDLETLGKGAGCVVISISAVPFFKSEPRPGGRIFRMNVDMNSCLDKGLTIDPGTLLFWMGMPGLFLQLQENTCTLEYALKGLSRFLRTECDKDVRIWGRGPSFDQAILRDLYARSGQQIPWRYSRERCVRTYLCGYEELLRKHLPFEGAEHDPAADCIHQIRSMAKVQSLVNPDGYSIDSFEQVCKIAGVDPATYKMADNATDEQRGIIAFSKLQLIYKVFNQGWKPDWTNSSQYKYYPWFKCAGSGFAFDDCCCDCTYSDVGARLCTDTAEKAEYIGKTFISIYNEFLTIQ